MMVSRLAVFASALLAAGTLLAAGAHDSGHTHGASVGQPGEAADATRTVTVAMYDNYYEPETIEVSAGETVRFIVENKGQLVHEFNIGTQAMHEEHQAEMLAMVEHGVLLGARIDHEKMAMDMGDGHSMKHDDANSVLLEPGQSEEMIWMFSKQGDLEFACNVPGHYQAGMVGKVKFE